MAIVVSPALTRRVRALAIAAPLLITSTAVLAQRAPKDSAQTDTSRAQKLERVMISAVRASGTAPISEKTLGAQELTRRNFGQDVPQLLQGAAPSLTSYAETANYWGYSYIRLRGIDQSRINLTLDGIPLNDPEDQVLYFADFPDLATSLHSVQVQRGVGTSSNGTAAYAGSINLETVPLAATPRGGQAQVEGGSFGSKRLSADFASGLLPSRFAFYGRVSGLRTNGYRYHSGVEGKSVFFSGGYFGDHDILKATVTTGTMRDTMAYLAVAKSDLDTNRRINPLTPRERDGFTERLAALAYTRLLSPSSSISTTVYRLSTSGDYDVLIDSLDNFNLKYAWYGITSDWSLRRNALQVDVGANANTYARDHSEFQPPDFKNPVYLNTGHKQDISGFAKAGYTVGAATVFGDLQLRHAEFRYSPDAHAGISERSVSWSFFNPKVGMTYDFGRHPDLGEGPLSPLSLYVSYGQNTREPARNDMFAGFDNVDTSNVEFIGSLDRVKPETVHDLEAGARYRTTTVDLAANVYSMDFRNEIAPIGELSYLGSPLRKNVKSSYRRGVEGDVTVRATSRLTLGGNVAASMNRIREYTDLSGDTPVTYHDVEPLLTPRLLGSARATVSVSKGLSVTAEGRHQSRSYLQNTSNPDLVLPAFSNLDASVSWQVGNYEVVARANNLTDSKAYASGYASGGAAYYFVVPPRNFFVTVKASF